jgi:hypothetical protein
MEEENIDPEKMMHFSMLINHRQKISYGAIKGLCVSQNQDKKREALSVYLQAINNTEIILKQKIC